MALNWSCTTATRLVDCVLADVIPAGEKRVLELSTKIVGDGAIKNTATVSGGGARTGDRDVAVVPPTSGGTDPGGDGGPLPSTGGPPFWILLLALGLLAGGGSLLVRRRGGTHRSES